MREMKTFPSLVSVLTTDSDHFAFAGSKRVLVNEDEETSRCTFQLHMYVQVMQTIE